jgi:hypothetical protein
MGVAMCMYINMAQERGLAGAAWLLHHLNFTLIQLKPHL